MSEETIQSKGGKARAQALSPERLVEIGKQGAMARWSGKKKKKAALPRLEFDMTCECCRSNMARITESLSK